MKCWCAGVIVNGFVSFPELNAAWSTYGGPVLLFKHASGFINCVIRNPKSTIHVKMNWGIELWDQYENIAIHTQRGIDFMEKCGHFIKERCAIETEYASKLRRLVKNYQPKKKDEEESQFTSLKAFIAMLNEINDLAGQHEIIAENLGQCIFRGIITLIKELKEEKKKHLQDGAKLQAQLQASYFQLEKTKRSYEKAFKESEKALENYQKADADLNLSRAEVEKARNLKQQKTKQCDDSKNDYASQLQETNRLQTQHYTQLMPNVFKSLQIMDEKRITELQKLMKQSADIERKVFPILNQCLDGITKAADSINPTEDSRLVIEKYKSGFLPPADIPFEDLGNMKQGSTGSGGSNGSSDGSCNGPVSYPSIRSDSATIRGTVTASRMKSRKGIFGFFGASKEDYSDLPPNQRRKKLQQKIDYISAQIQQETAARDGLMKMKVVYEQNSALGDPLSIEGQLTENGQKLDRLRQDLHKYQNYLAEADGKAVTPSLSHRNRNSISDDSLSRSASDSSMTNPINNNSKLSAPGTPLPSHFSTISVEAPTAQPEYTNEEEEANGGEFDDVDALPVLGTCRALYSFDAQSEGSIPMQEDEEFQVIELDQGDGWTRVRRENNEEGFVPSSYITCFLYTDV